MVLVILCTGRLQQSTVSKYTKKNTLNRYNNTCSGGTETPLTQQMPKPNLTPLCACRKDKIKFEYAFVYFVEHKRV
jgi:hypothetical protein